MMQNYWIGIMAGAFVIAMTIWLALVFNADRRPRDHAQSSWPHREVMGGSFDARDGGRQLMPIPGEPSGEDSEPSQESGAESEPGRGRAQVPEQASGPGPGQARRQVPGQATAPATEQAQEAAAKAKTDPS